MIGNAEKFFRAFGVVSFFFGDGFKNGVGVVWQTLFEHLCDKEKGRGGLYSVPPVMPLSVYPIAYFAHGSLSNGESLFYLLYVIEFLPGEKLNLHLFGIKIARCETFGYNLWCTSHVTIRCCFAVDGVA